MLMSYSSWYTASVIFRKCASLLSLSNMGSLKFQQHTCILNDFFPLPYLIVVGYSWRALGEQCFQRIYFVIDTWIARFWLLKISSSAECQMLCLWGWVSQCWIWKRFSKHTVAWTRYNSSEWANKLMSFAWLYCLLILNIQNNWNLRYSLNNLGWKISYSM